jgi:hypothetical protein
MNIVVLDKDSKQYFTNTSGFRLTHPERAVSMDPGVVYRISPDKWLMGQPAIKACDENGEAPKEAAKPEVKAGK